MRIDCRKKEEESMRTRPLLPLAAGLLAAASLHAQTKISGTLQCAKSNPQYAIEVPDGAKGHALELAKTARTWSKPIEMAGLQSKDGASVAVADGKDNHSADRGYHTGTMSNGDHYWVQFQGVSESANGSMQSQTGTWNFAGGTGKLKGLQGKGTYKTKGAPDGTATVQVEGTYKLP